MSFSNTCASPLSGTRAALLCLSCLQAAHAQVPPGLPPATLYIANEGQADGSGSSVSVIDARSLKVTSTIDFGKAGPVYPIMSPDKKDLWVTHEVYDFNTGGCDGSGVSVVPLAKMKIGADIPLPQCPNTLVFSPDGKFAYTPSVAGPVSVIDTAKRSVIASITVSTGQYDIALSRDGRWLYAADASDANLTVIDTRNDTPVRQIALNSLPFAIVLAPDGRHAFVTTESSTASIEEIDLDTDKVVAMIPPVVSSTTNGLAISSNGKLLYDVDYNAQTVWLYNTYGQSQIGGITPFSYPLGIALSPDGRFVYVTNNNCAAFPCTTAGFVTIVSTLTHTVLGTVNVGINPQFITVFPRSEAGLVHHGD